MPVTLRRALFVFFAAFALLFGSCAEPIQPELEVVPQTQTLEVGQSVRLFVTRQYVGGSSRDVTHLVTYASTDRNVATVSRDGILTGGPGKGSVTIRIVDDATDTSTTLTVNVVEQLVSIEVSPSAVVMPPGSTRQFNAQARFRDGSTRDVTRNVEWASSDTTVATVGATTFDYGVVNTIGNGRARITATDRVTNVQGTSDVFVEGRATQLQAIVVTPNPAAPIGVAGALQFTATGYFANATTRDISANVVWQSSVPGVATISTTGLATGVAAGDTTISAIGTDPSVRGSAPLKVQ